MTQPSTLPNGPDATLIFNQKAGGSETASPEHLIEKLYQLGYRAVYRATDSEEDLKKALTQATGTVFVAGGDGTIRAAALHLTGRPNVVLAPIPMGTANNIGRTLGLTGEPLEVLESYRVAQVQPFDVGKVTAPWGQDLFLEAFGCGAFADIITEYDPEGGKSPLRAVQALATTLGNFDPPMLSLQIDGVTLPAAAYALLEVMNTRATGPRLQLATHADPGDGLLDVILVDAGHRQNILTYVAALARDEFAELPSVDDRRARQLRIPYAGQAFHVDGEVRPPLPTETGEVTVELWAGALRVLVPAPQEAAQ